MNGNTLYQGYNRAGLDAQYDNRARVPEHVEIHAAYQDEGDAVLADFETRLDVSYGPSDEETLDIYLPGNSASAAGGGAPVNVFLHGGYWFSRHKNDFRFLARGLVPAGGVLVVVNYALIPSVDLDELVRQCRAAVAWTYHNAAAFGGDAERLYVSGHSAGGHLTAMMMAADWPASGLPADTVKGGCALSGLYDLTPIPLGYMQDTLGFTPEQVARNSPIALAPPPGAPLIVAVGGDESEEFLRQSGDFADQWQAGGTPVRSMVLPDINHFTILGEFANPESDLTGAVQKQMGLG